MIVSCPSCQARFQYDESRFQGAPQKRFRCPKCATVFEVINPALEVTAATLHPMPTSAAAPPVIQAQVAYPASASHPAAHAHQMQAPPAHPQVPLPTHVPAPQPPAFQPPPVPLPTPTSQLPPTPPQAMPPLPPAPLPTLPSVPNLNQGIETTLLDSPRGTTSSLNRNPTRNNLATTIPAGFRFSLAFLSGSLSGSVRPITTPITVIGREEGDIITGDPECSRRHCEISIQQDGTVWMRDLGSTNGTYVDGVQVFGSAQLADRQEFTCGRSTFMILIRNEDLQMI